MTTAPIPGTGSDADVAARRGRFFFFSNEGQESPHVQVRKSDGLAKLWLSPVQLAYAHGLTPAELRRVRELTREHVANLPGAMA